MGSVLENTMEKAVEDGCPYLNKDYQD